MGKYRVNVLGLQGRGKKVFKAGDLITDSQLPEDNAKELVKKGFLKPAKLSAKEKKVEDAQERVKKAKADLEAATAVLNDADGDEALEAAQADVDKAEDEVDAAEKALKELTK